MSQVQAADGPIVAYDFAKDIGNVVYDRSGISPPLHLEIKDRGHVRRAVGAIEIQKGTILRSQQPAKKVIDAVKRSGEISVETWVTPANRSQDGPARIVTISSDTTHRLMTLGQEGDRFDVRMRSSKTDSNGLPSTPAGNGKLTTNMQHVVYVRQRDGRTRVHVDGRIQGQSRAAGDLSPWNQPMHLAIGNELTGDRPWLGTIRSVAIFSRALGEAEIQKRFAETMPNKIAALPAKMEQPSTGKAPVASAGGGTGGRVGKGLQVFYDFSETSGDQVLDRSGAAEPIHLQIDKMDAVRRGPGVLNIVDKTILRSESPPRRLNESIKRTGEVTLEAWVNPAATSQSGPARIITISKDGNKRNATLGQDGSKYIARLKTTKTTENGLPSTDSPGNTAQTRLTHLVYTRDRSGEAALYVNGKQVGQRTVSGDLQNWDPSYHIALGDEFGGGRLWKGAYHLVAVYNRALSEREVSGNFRAGPNATTGATNYAVAKSQNAALFESKIAPLLAKHCLECHDAATHQGGLSLAHKSSAFGESDSGKAIVPKKADDSLLWQSVEHDEMPHERTPLTSAEKEILRQWIEGGAEWTLEMVDPAVYVHSGRKHENWLRRLTVSEYIQTVRTTLGVDISDQAGKVLPPDMRADGFHNTAYNLNVDLQHVDAYAKLARIIVQRMEPMKFAKRFRNKLSMTDKDMRGLIDEMGKWILRGPLEEREIILYRGVSTSVASAGGDVEDAIGYVIQAMLQSPRFLYRIENQRGDGRAWQVSEYELTSRISYILWGSSPDEELFRLAGNGELFEPDVVAKQVDRMLRDQRAIDRSITFVSQWLDLDRLNNLKPDQERFPNWNAELAQAMRAETLSYAKHVLWKEKRPISDLLCHPVSFLTPELAKHYGIDSRGDGQQQYDLADTPRGGILTQGSVLTVGGDDASMVTRGLLVMHELLRGVVKDPPPCVDTTPVPSKPGLSQRAIAGQRIANHSCGGCHSKFEPLAFGFEKFDGLGGYHEKDEHGNHLREDGEVLIPGAAKPATYKTSRELVKLLASSERVKESLTWKLTQFSLGRPLLPADALIVSKIHAQAQKAGGTYQATIAAIVNSELVQKIETE